MTCLETLGYIFLKIGLYQHVEEIKLDSGKIEIIHVYPKGHEPTEEERNRVRENYLKGKSK